MKVAIFHNLLFGGAKRVMVEQARFLKKNGHDVDVFTTSTENDQFDMLEVSDHVFTYPFEIKKSIIPLFGRMVQDLNNFYFLNLHHKKIAKEIHRRKYDVLLVHPDRFTQAPFLLKYSIAPSAYYCEEPLRMVYEYSLRLREQVGFFKRLYEELTRLYRKRIDRENARNATVPIASCFHIRERMIEAYDVYPQVAYPGVDENIFKPKKMRKKNEVLFIGNKDVVNDGYDLVVAALRKIPKQIRPKLHIIEWKKQNKERMSEDELVNLYNSVKITLCLSRFETFGLVPLESMACATPVIATNVSGHRETVINGKTGFLVDFNPKEIAEKITYLLANPEILEKIGGQARLHVLASWTWRRKGEDLEKILQNLSSRK